MTFLARSVTAGAEREREQQQGLCGALLPWPLLVSCAASAVAASAAVAAGAAVAGAAGVGACNFRKRNNEASFVRGLGMRNIPISIRQHLPQTDQNCLRRVKRIGGWWIESSWLPPDFASVRTEALSRGRCSLVCVSGDDLIGLKPSARRSVHERQRGENGQNQYM